MMRYSYPGANLLNRMKPVCVVFDVDDTLYLERDYVRSGFRAVGVWASRWLGLSGFAERCQWPPTSGQSAARLQYSSRQYRRGAAHAGTDISAGIDLSDPHT